MTVRILHIIDRLDCYGPSRQLSLLVQGLSPSQFCNRICALDVSAALPEQLAAAPESICVLASRGLSDPTWPVRLWRLLLDFRPQIIHGWGRRANLVATLATIVQKKAVLILGQRCTLEQCGSGHALLQPAMFRRAQKIVVNSAAIWDQCVARGIAKEKMTLISNGIVPLQPPPVSRRQLLAELGLPPDSRLVCAGGRLHSHMGIKDAVWAADLLKVIRKDVHLLIAGDGPQRERLVAFRDQVRIQDKVHFLGCRTDLRWIVAHCDVFWAIGHRIGQPNAILEAMAASVPVVATDVPGNRELLQHDVTGYLIPPADRAALARFTNRLLDQPEVANRLRQAARDRALAEFSAAKMAARYAQLYQEVL